jgi:hypothetical protein
MERGDSPTERGRASMLRRVEFASAILITCAAVWLHVSRAMQAGALWRDEVSIVNLAQLPTLAGVAGNLHHEAFPILFPIVLRGVAFVAGGGDATWRVFGLLVGLSLLAVVWCVGRTFDRVPLLSLALLGVNASTIVWVDWVRGHGLGTVLILVTLLLVWRFATAPSMWLGVATALAAVCAVQTLYYNAVLLFAIGVAGAATAVRAGAWQRALGILLIGALSAASLTPYLAISRRAAGSSFIYTVAEFPLALFWSKLREALSGTASGFEWGWIVLACLAVGVGVWTQLRGPDRSARGKRDAALYFLVILIVSVPAYFAFLKMLKYQTQPWYYVPLTAVVAVAIDVLLSSSAARAVTISRVAVACALVVWSFPTASKAIQTRQSNVAAAAAKVRELASADDVVVVMPWYLGVPFERYYKASAPWLTVPPISDRKLQRYDLLKEQMAEADPLPPVFDAMARALRAGNRVWLVGQLMFPESDAAPPILAPAPQTAAGWSEGAYQTSWNLRTTHFLQSRVLRAEDVPIASERVNPHEAVRVVVVQGWRGGSAETE